MDSSRLAVWCFMVMVAVASSAQAQGKSAAAQGGTTQGAPFQQLQAQMTALETQVAAMQQQIHALQAQVTQVESRLQAQIAAINERLISLQAQVTENDATTASLNGRIAANESAIAALTIAVEALRDQLTSTEALIAGNSGNIAALQQHVGHLQALITAHSSQITSLQQQSAALAQFQVNLVNGTCATGAAVQDVAPGGFIVCSQPGGATMQTVTRTAASTLFTGTNVLTVACPAGYVATGSGFTVPAAVETQHYVSHVNLATQTVSSAVRNVAPITVSQSTTGPGAATVQVQYLPHTFFSGYFVQAQVTCAR